MRRTAAVATIGAVIALLAIDAASARPLTATSKKVASGQASVTPCGSLTTAVVSYTVTSGNVTKLVITGLPSACNGGSLTATLAGMANANLGQGGPVTIASQAATFTSLS